MSRDRAHMSAIGREGGHSRGRARQGQTEGNGGTGISSGQTDTERSNYIGHASDRGNLGTSSAPGSSNRPGDRSVNESSARNTESGGRNQY